MQVPPSPQFSCPSTSCHTPELHLHTTHSLPTLFLHFWMSQVWIWFEWQGDYFKSAHICLTGSVTDLSWVHDLELLWKFMEDGICSIFKSSTYFVGHIILVSEEASCFIAVLYFSLWSSDITDTLHCLSSDTPQSQGSNLQKKDAETWAPRFVRHDHYFPVICWK